MRLGPGGPGGSPPRATPGHPLAADTMPASCQNTGNILNGVCRQAHSPGSQLRGRRRQGSGCPPPPCRGARQAQALRPLLPPGGSAPAQQRAQPRRRLAENEGAGWCRAGREAAGGGGRRQEAAGGGRPSPPSPPPRSTGTGLPPPLPNPRDTPREPAECTQIQAAMHMRTCPSAQLATAGSRRGKGPAARTALRAPGAAGWAGGARDRAWQAGPALAAAATASGAQHPARRAPCNKQARGGDAGVAGRGHARTGLRAAAGQAAAGQSGHTACGRNTAQDSVPTAWSSNEHASPLHVQRQLHSYPCLLIACLTFSKAMVAPTSAVRDRSRGCLPLATAAPPSGGPGRRSTRPCPPSAPASQRPRTAAAAGRAGTCAEQAACGVKNMQQ